MNTNKQAATRSNSSSNKPFEQTISVIIHTKNSAATLPDTLQSVIWADEIVIADMHSTDSTEKIVQSFAKKHAAVKTTWFPVADVGYVEPARNKAIAQAKGKWICIVDSDEIVPDSLAKALIEITKQPDAASAYSIPRKNIVFGDWLAGAGWWPDHQLRFFQKGAVTWSDTIHAQPSVDGSVIVLPAEESLSLIHNNYPDVSSFITRLDRYTDQEVKTRQVNEAPESILVSRWSAELYRRLFLFEGIEHGVRGISVAWLQSMYEFVVLLKQWEQASAKMSANKSSQENNAAVAAAIVAQLQAHRSDLQYWIADWHVKKSSGLKKLWWQLRRKWRV